MYSLFSELNSKKLSGNKNYYEHLGNFLELQIEKTARWLLCYRASLHGWLVETFHSNCDGKNNTITIIKKDNYVFGGYTDIPWGKTINFDRFACSCRSYIAFWVTPPEANIVRTECKHAGHIIFSISHRFFKHYTLVMCDDNN